MSRHVIQVHAQYRQFTVQSDTSSYVLSVDGYSGNAGNSFMEGSLELFGVNRTMTIHNGMKFSTYDRDNDNWCVSSYAKPQYRDPEQEVTQLLNQSDSCLLAPGIPVILPNSVPGRMAEGGGTTAATLPTPTAATTWAEPIPGRWPSTAPTMAWSG